MLLLYLGKDGDPPQALHGKIRKPGENKALTSFAVQNNDIIAPSGHWLRVPLSDRADIKANELYEIVLDCEACNANNNYKWYFASGNAVDGNAAAYKASVFDNMASNDFAFGVYGIETPSPPAITISSVGGDSSEPYEITGTAPKVVFTTDENAWCRASLANKGYDEMPDSTSVTGGGTTLHTYTLPSVGELKNVRQLKVAYIACRDSVINSPQNRHTEKNNKLVPIILEPVVPLGANEVRNAGFETYNGWTLYSSNIGRMTGGRINNAALEKMLAQYPALTRGSNEWPREGAWSYLLESKGDTTPTDYAQIMQENVDLRGAKKLVFSINPRTNAGASEPYYLQVLAGPKGQETEIFKTPLDYTAVQIAPNSGMNIADPAKFDISTSELPPMGTGNLIIRLNNPKNTTSTAQVLIDNLRKVPR